MVGKKNAINLMIVIVALLLITAIAMRFYGAEEKTLNFSGPNVYRAVYVYDAMQKQGYSVNLTFSGRWTDTNEKTSGSGLILKGELGEFTILLDSRQVTVGGPFSSADDIQASSLILVPNHRAVVKIGLEPFSRNSLAALNLKLESFAQQIIPAENIYEIGVEGDITLDVSNNLKPTITQDLNNIMPQNEFVLYDNGLILKLESANIEGLKSVNQLFAQKNISVQKVATSQLILYVRTKEIPAESSAALLAKAQDSGSLGLFLLRIITNPVQ